MTLAQLTKANREVLSQLENLVSNLEDSQFVAPQKEAFNASIGQHVRHILEFYLCLFKGAEIGQVNYDARKRDKEIEENRTHALQVLHSILDTLSEDHTNKPLELCAELSKKDATATKLATNYERELLYTLEHAIHHMAIIKIIVNLKYAGVKLMKNFGVAFSTIAFKEAHAS